MEIRCGGARDLARIAWHIGNRHLAAEIGEDTIRIRADHVIGEMVRQLGGEVVTLNDSFNPERGAYGQAAAHDDYGHGSHE